MRQRDILTVTSTTGTLALAISQEQDKTLFSSLEEEAEQDHRDLGERKQIQR